MPVAKQAPTAMSLVALSEKSFDRYMELKSSSKNRSGVRSIS
jgi:hypothetical protein